MGDGSVEGDHPGFAETISEPAGCFPPSLPPCLPAAALPFRRHRWITLALTQEFSFPDALRLWDTLLADRAGRSDCLMRLCTAMLLHVREQLLQVRQAGSCGLGGAGGEALV